MLHILLDGKTNLLWLSCHFPQCIFICHVCPPPRPSVKLLNSPVSVQSLYWNPNFCSNHINIAIVLFVVSHYRISDLNPGSNWFRPPILRPYCHCGNDKINIFFKSISLWTKANKPTAGRTKAIHRRLELSFNLYLLLLFVGQNRASKSLLHITPRIFRFLQFFNK